MSDRPRRAPTAALLAAAAVAAACFAVGIRQSTEEHDATVVVSRLSALTPAESRRVADRLDGAGWLNPDRHIDVLRAELALHHRDIPRARGLLESVMRDEPQDVEAWALLADALKGSDPAAARRARARVLELAPPVPSP